MQTIVQQTTPSDHVGRYLSLSMTPPQQQLSDLQSYKILRKLQNSRSMNEKLLQQLISLIKTSSISIFSHMNLIFKRFQQQLKQTDLLNAQMKNNTPILQHQLDVVIGSKYWKQGVAIQKQLFKKLYHALNNKLNKKYQTKLIQNIAKQKKKKSPPYNQQQKISVLELTFPQPTNLRDTIKQLYFLKSYFQNTQYLSQTQSDQQQSQQKYSQRFSSYAYKQKNKKQQFKHQTQAKPLTKNQKIIKFVKKITQLKQKKQNTRRQQYVQLYDDKQSIVGCNFGEKEYQFYDFKECWEKVVYYCDMVYGLKYKEKVDRLEFNQEVYQTTKYDSKHTKTYSIDSLDGKDKIKIQRVVVPTLKINRERSGNIPIFTMAINDLSKQSHALTIAKIILSMLNNVQGGEILLNCRQNIFSLKISDQDAIFNYQKIKKLYQEIKPMINQHIKSFTNLTNEQQIAQLYQLSFLQLQYIQPTTPDTQQRKHLKNTSQPQQFIQVQKRILLIPKIQIKPQTNDNLVGVKENKQIKYYICQNYGFIKQMDEIQRKSLMEMKSYMKKTTDYFKK